jgi:hypothetical protein
MSICYERGRVVVFGRVRGGGRGGEERREREEVAAAGGPGGDEGKDLGEEALLDSGVLVEGRISEVLVERDAGGVCTSCE